MCAIFGLTTNDSKILEKLPADRILSSLLRRGPDDHGFLSFRRCALGNTRLSIIDLSPSGHQPMRDSEKNTAITFNGEIYNYKELRNELEKKGHLFATHSDTEVILKCYQEYGVDCPKYLDGMFAFGIWDEEKQLLFLARDRFGKKPLYYAFDNDKNFLFASEIKALFASDRIRGIIDPKAIDNYLRLMYVPAHKTIYKNIFTLLPAEYAVYKDGKLSKNIYWQLEYKPLPISYADAKEKIRRLFTQAVKKRLVADVEIGSLLSGGVDSTLVTAYAQRLNGRQLKTFSLGYGDHINELPYAEQASKKIGTDHYTLQTNEDILKELNESIAYFDEPHADSSDFPQSILSKLARGKVKVALSGDGADELFMGYGFYQKHLHLPFFKRHAKKLFSNPFQDYLKNIAIFTEKERHALWIDSDSMNDDFIAKKISGKDFITNINEFGLTTYLPGQLLTKIDRMGMMHSLEIRSPFLDHQLAEFVFSLPQAYKTDKKENKIILKDILSEIMPREFVYRRKQGFGAPVADWLQFPKFRKFTLDTLSDKNALLYQFLKYNTVTALLKKFYEKDDIEKNYKIWTLLCLELWLKSHQDCLQQIDS